MNCIERWKFAMKQEAMKVIDCLNKCMELFSK
jgi:hypothetical protein